VENLGKADVYQVEVLASENCRTIGRRVWAASRQEGQEDEVVSSIPLPRSRNLLHASWSFEEEFLSLCLSTSRWERGFPEFSGHIKNLVAVTELRTIQGRALNNAILFQTVLTSLES
jgi:hypothetical protein